MKKFPKYIERTIPVFKTQEREVVLDMYPVQKKAWNFWPLRATGALFKRRPCSTAGDNQTVKSYFYKCFHFILFADW